MPLGASSSLPLASRLPPKFVCLLTSEVPVKKSKAGMRTLEQASSCLLFRIQTTSKSYK